MTRNWIVMHGNLLNTTAGYNGFELFGPYTEAEAEAIRGMLAHPDVLTLAVELLRLPNLERKYAKKAPVG